MAYFCQAATQVPLQSYRYQLNVLPDGERDGTLDATRNGCATVVHADIRGLVTSGQICVAGAAFALGSEINRHAFFRTHAECTNNVVEVSPVAAAAPRSPSGIS